MGTVIVYIVTVASPTGQLVHHKSQQVNLEIAVRSEPVDGLCP